MKALVAYFSAGGVTAGLAILAGVIRPVFLIVQAFFLWYSISRQERLPEYSGQ